MAMSKKLDTKSSLRGSIATAAISSLLFFAACGDDGSSKGPEPVEGADSADIVAETFDDLPVCTDKREGATAYLKDENSVYTCIDGSWILSFDSDEVAVKDKSISGVSQKGPFVTGSAVKLYELDGKSERIFP